MLGRLHLPVDPLERRIRPVAAAIRDDELETLRERRLRRPGRGRSRRCRGRARGAAPSPLVGDDPRVHAEHCTNWAENPAVFRIAEPFRSVTNRGRSHGMLRRAWSSRPARASSPPGQGPSSSPRPAPSAVRARSSAGLRQPDGRGGRRHRASASPPASSPSTAATGDTSREPRDIRHAAAGPEPASPADRRRVVLFALALPLYRSRASALAAWALAAASGSPARRSRWY